MCSYGIPYEPLTKQTRLCARKRLFAPQIKAVVVCSMGENKQERTDQKLILDSEQPVGDGLNGTLLLAKVRSSVLLLLKSGEKHFLSRAQESQMGPKNFARQEDLTRRSPGEQWTSLGEQKKFLGLVELVEQQNSRNNSFDSGRVLCNGETRASFRNLSKKVFEHMNPVVNKVTLNGKPVDIGAWGATAARAGCQEDERTERYETLFHVA
jgi:hypothetical protein